MHLGARYYMPEVGRFAARDPMDLRANPYAYANSNPLSYVAPSGLKSWWNPLPSAGADPKKLRECLSDARKDYDLGVSDCESSYNSCLDDAYCKSVGSTFWWQNPIGVVGSAPLVAQCWAGYQACLLGERVLYGAQYASCVLDYAGPAIGPPDVPVAPIAF
jgi:hypothetical protein